VSSADGSSFLAAARASSNDPSRPSFHAARCRHPDLYGKPVARVGHDHERSGPCTHGVTGWLSERGRGPDCGSRARTPVLTTHISAATSIGRFDAGSPKEIVSETRPTRIQHRPVEMDAGDSSEGSGKPAMTRENDRSRQWHKFTLVALLIRGSEVRIPPGAQPARPRSSRSYPRLTWKSARFLPFIGALALK
jgi:hypothetical protein